MPSRTYGQFCGFAHALDMVGERWALLIVRDLVLGPKRFTDLHRGLPRIPTNILSARLKELEQAGVIRRRLLPRPGSAVVYELTEYGRGLEDIVLRLGRWGAQTMGDPSPDDVLNADSLQLALHATFLPDAARWLRAKYELRVGPVVIHAEVNTGGLTVGEGPLPDADLVIEAGPAIRALLAGEITPEQAVGSGSIQIAGDPSFLERFAEVFQIPRMPVVAGS